jgi:hypothetical protein
MSHFKHLNPLIKPTSKRLTAEEERRGFEERKQEIMANSEPNKTKGRYKRKEHFEES